MGLFNRKRYSESEQRLLDDYTALITRMSKLNTQQAHSTAKQWLDEAIKSSKATGLYYLPTNLGDLLVGRTKMPSEPSWLISAVNGMQERLKKRRQDHEITDDDVCRAWNCSEVDRRMADAMDIFLKEQFLANRIAKYCRTISRDKASDKAFADLYKRFAVYGNPDDTTLNSGDNRPLPPELFHRISIYIEKRTDGDCEAFQKDMEEASSFNALIRQEMHSDNL